ncbi:MAG: hypothetical protein ABIA62_06670 [Candidatus Woesearchaeota archaeon]
MDPEPKRTGQQKGQVLNPKEHQYRDSVKHGGLKRKALVGANRDAREPDSKDGRNLFGIGMR